MTTHRLRRMQAGMAVLLAAVSTAGHAHAEDLCAPLQTLLAAAPAAFISGRGPSVGVQEWAAKPVVPTAGCSLWGAREDDAYNLDCSIHDGTALAPVQAFYTQNVAALGQCLPTFGGAPWKRTTRQVTVDGLRGEETAWVQETSAASLKISLASYERTVTSTFYDSLRVEYLRY